MKEGRKVYYVPSLIEKPVYGTITNIKHVCGETIVTIHTKAGKTITDTSNRFSIGYPAILNYWNN